jgi:hypothetical protein
LADDLHTNDRSADVTDVAADVADPSVADPSVVDPSGADPSGADPSGADPSGAGSGVDRSD